MKYKEVKITKNTLVRYIWLCSGFLFTGIGILGYIVPFLPGTTFILLALYCFARSNEKWHNWILNNKYFGQTIRDIKEGKGMTRSAKLSAYGFISASICISMYFATNAWVMLFLVIFGSIAILCVKKQNTKPDDK